MDDSRKFKQQGALAHRLLYIRVTPGSFLQGAYSFAPIARKFRYCIAESSSSRSSSSSSGSSSSSSTSSRKAATAAAAAAQAAQAAADKQHMHKASSTQAYKQQEDMVVLGEARARSRRGPRQHIPAQTSCQAQKHPSSKVHMATCLRSKVHTAAPCSGTSAQALKRTQQRHSATRQHPSSPAHPAAAPAPKLEHANTQLFLHWNNSGTLQRHQHPCSKTHTCSSLK